MAKLLAFLCRRKFEIAVLAGILAPGAGFCQSTHGILLTGPSGWRSMPAAVGSFGVGFTVLNRWYIQRDQILCW
jgi:hypothetical protein